MRTIYFRIVVAGVLGLFGCGDPPVSDTCSASEECDDDLTCLTQVPGGYCTAACTTGGSTDECPDGSVCDGVSGVTGNTCVKICKTTEDCRSDLDCNGVTGTNIKACKPKS